MSVKVEQLTKLYGEQKAVNEISFSAESGRILGFLGPNGAGKSTTMKILSCFIPPSSGRASLCGFDVIESPLEVRKNLGYLPEHNPLYLDMYVKESLEFVGRIHGIPNASSRIGEVIELTGLGLEQHKKVGALSKGYRQRLGIAQAIIHDPQVLILDEPTSGLDPNQLIEIRSLVQSLGCSKTVIFSTHIMQEVEAVCDDVIIINRGQIVAHDSLAGLKLSHQNQSLENIFLTLTRSNPFH
ncbi:ATP-binding cassette domain-containing protein [Pedobacter sp. SYSU D00535]|uniref:ATP-binding cassette domain-containing protein n=1 Tax=Pedobacter sp. SYSU D00535 TaxID=2810308 RepID=UPI001A96D5F4|nr:ATP-binding cassette domain-containing protein [Pedobacter sp. SYSU D00535]